MDWKKTTRAEYEQYLDWSIFLNRSLGPLQLLRACLTSSFGPSTDGGGGGNGYSRMWIPLHDKSV